MAIGGGQHHLPARARRLVAPSAVRATARRAAELVALDRRAAATGPAELSGGMRQRVGARPGARARAAGAAARRAVQRARCADVASGSTSSCSRLWERAAHHDRARHPQHRGGDPRRGPGRRPVAAAGPRRGGGRRRRCRGRARRRPRRGGRVATAREIRGHLGDAAVAATAGRRMTPVRGRCSVVARRSSVFVARLAAGRRRRRLPAVHPAAPGAGRGRFVTAWADGTIQPHLRRRRSSRSPSGSPSARASALVVGYALARSARRRAARSRPTSSRPRRRRSSRWRRCSRCGSGRGCSARSSSARSSCSSRSRSRRWSASARSTPACSSSAGRCARPVARC